MALFHMRLKVQEHDNPCRYNFHDFNVSLCDVDLVRRRPVKPCLHGDCLALYSRVELYIKLGLYPSRCQRSTHRKGAYFVGDADKVVLFFKRS